MSARISYSSLAGEGDWEIISTHTPQTSFAAVSWAFRPPQDPQLKRKAFHGSLFTITDPSRLESTAGSNTQRPTPHQTHGHTHADDSLNPDLPGVQAALEVLLIYEECVGFNFTPYPEILPRELGISSWPRNVVDADEDCLRFHQGRWREWVEDLMNPDLVHTESDESLAGSIIDSLSSSIDLHQSAATLSSEATSSDGSVDSFVMPETPKPKPLSASVEISGLSPSSSEVLSPGRGLNASASSFVPTFLSQLHDEPLHFPSLHDPPPSPSRQRRGKHKPHKPSSSSTSFANFTFPTLNGPSNPAHSNEDQLVAAATIGDIDNSESSPKDLLPPFLQESPGRARARKSRTREIVDRLRSRAAAAATTSPTSPKASTSLLEDPVPIRFASHSPGPVSGGDDLSLSVSSIASRQTVSEDGGDRSLHGSTMFEEDESGWIDVASPPASVSSVVTPATLSPVVSKPNRARDLVLALARRRTNSQSSELLKEESSSHGSSSTSSTPSSTMDFKSPSPSGTESSSPATTNSNEHNSPPAVTTTTATSLTTTKVDNTLKCSQVQQPQTQKNNTKSKPPPSPNSGRNAQHNRKPSTAGGMSHLSRSSISSSAASTSPTAFVFNPNSPAYPSTMPGPLMPLGGAHYFFPGGTPGYPMNMPLGVPFNATGPSPAAGLGAGFMPFSAGGPLAGTMGPTPGMPMKLPQGGNTTNNHHLHPHHQLPPHLHHQQAQHLLPGHMGYGANVGVGAAGAPGGMTMPHLGPHLGLGHSGKGGGLSHSLGMNVNAIQVPGGASAPYVGNAKGW